MDEKQTTVRLHRWLTYLHNPTVPGTPDWGVQQEPQDHWRTDHTHTSSTPPAQGKRPPWWGRGPRGCCPRCAWWRTPSVAKICEEREVRGQTVGCEDTQRHTLTEIHSKVKGEAALKTQVHDSTPWCQSLFPHNAAAGTFKLFVIYFHQSFVNQ